MSTPEADGDERTRQVAAPGGSDPLPVIGWREWAALPDLGIPAIRVKVDTGARTSALHVHGLQLIERDGVQLARFKLMPVRRRVRPSIAAEAPVVRFRDVRNSGGVVQKRATIRTDIVLWGQRWPIEITLARRDRMGYRMLLGRLAIRGRFLVDAGSSYLAGTPPGLDPADPMGAAYPGGAFAPRHRIQTHGYSRAVRPPRFDTGTDSGPEAR